MGVSDDQVCVHESEDLWAKDIVGNWSIIPEADPSTDEVTLDDIYIPDPCDTPNEDLDRLSAKVFSKNAIC